MIKITKIKDIHIEILFIILLSLIFILWGRILYREFNTKKYLDSIHTKADRLNALAYFGWEVFPETEESEKITIPQTFDSVYKEYNRLQKLSGFDLEDFKGQEAYRFTYIAKNFPSKTDTDVFINILIKDGRIIGGDCMSPALSGFMLPLDRRFSP